MIHILYFFSKTDAGVIQHCPVYTKNIHATFGFFVLMTGVMAFISGSYAISNMFLYEDAMTGKPQMIPGGWTYSFLLGSVYAMFIMAIDREIVSSSNRWAAVFRIPLAIIISLIVSVPVEMQIFEGKITKQLINNQIKERDDLKKKLNDENRVFKIEDDIKSTEALRQEAIDKRNYWAESIEAEVVGRVKEDRTGKAGKGPAYDEAIMNKGLQEQLIIKYDNELSEKKGQLESAKKERQRQFELEKVGQSYDLLSKYIALKEIKKEDKTGSAKSIGLGVLILFCLFEMIPALMKVLTPLTEYDVLVDKRRRLNINSAKFIYQQVYSEYGSMTTDEIVNYNPIAVGKIFASQSK